MLLFMYHVLQCTRNRGEIKPEELNENDKAQIPSF